MFTALIEVSQASAWTEGAGTEENVARLRLMARQKRGGHEGRKISGDLGEWSFSLKPPLSSCTPLQTSPLQAAQEPLNSSTSGCGSFQLSLQEWGPLGWEVSARCQETAKVDTRQCSEDRAIKLTLPPLHWLLKANRGDIVPHCMEWKIFA